MSHATVLYDAPGPVARRRQLFYSVLFAIVLIGVLAWIFLKLKAAGEFDQQVLDGLMAGNVWDAIGQGLIATLKAAALSIVLAVVMGFALAVGRLSDRPWISRPSWAIIEFFRAVPVLLMMIFLLKLSGGHGIAADTRGFIAVVGGLTLYNGSVLAEVFRAGVNAVPKGQSEAAYALGMRKSQVMQIVLMPQAVRYMMPAIISQCVVALKDTSLGFIVLYPELLRQAKLIAQYIGNNLMVFALVAVIYIILNSIVSAIATWLERRLSSRGSGSAAAIEAVEEQLPVG